MTFFELNEEKNVEYWCLDLGVVIFWLSEHMNTVMLTKNIQGVGKISGFLSFVNNNQKEYSVKIYIDFISGVFKCL